MNWKAFFKGFAAAVFGGAAASITQIVVKPVRLSPAGRVRFSSPGSILPDLPGCWQ
jgi:hypothetical protein